MEKIFFFAQKKSGKLREKVKLDASSSSNLTVSDFTYIRFDENEMQFAVQ